MAFSPGDIVQLKSGGPPMTVTMESPEGVHCIWYGETTEAIRTGVVPAVCLEPLIVGHEIEDAPAPSKPADL